MRCATVRFTNSRAAASTARHFATATACEWGLDDVSERLELLVSELVTNAVLHARSEGELRLSETDTGMHVDVADGSPMPPTMGTFDIDAASGRGLLLVDDLADAWGVDLTDDGKVVWFELSTT